MNKKYLNKKDINKVIQFWKLTWVYYAPEDREDVLDRLIDFDNEAIHIIEKDGKIVASAVIVYNPFQSYIYRFSVHPDCRWKWLWKELSDFVETTLKEKSMFNPTIFVEEENIDALKFWKKIWWERLYSVHCLVKNLK